MASVTELELRRAVLRYVHSLHDGSMNTLVVEEFGVRHGAGRVDVAVFNGQMDAYEIKSDLDRLSRLDRQINLFSSVFDSLTIVCGTRHADAALRLAPTWCGVLQLAQGRLSVLRVGGRSPAQTPSHLVKLLHKHEVVDLLRARAYAPRQGQTRANLYARLLERVSPDEVRSIVLSVIKQRVGGQRTPGDGLSPLEAMFEPTQSANVQNSYRRYTDPLPRNQRRSIHGATSAFPLVLDTV